jgi:multidrug efflux pump subunit AcrA (membrane-fusion protein)
MKRKIVLPLLSAALLTFAIYHVVSANQQPPKGTPPVDPSRTPFRNTIAGGGVVEARSENIAIGAHLPGVVAEVFVKVDQPLSGPTPSGPGTPLFRLDDRQLQAEWRVRKANLASARASLLKLGKSPRREEVPPTEARVREARAVLDDAKDQYQRAQQLLRTRAVGEEEVIKRRNAVAIAEAQLARAEAELALLEQGAWEYDKEIARAAVAQSEAMVKQTETEIARLTVHASIDGRVLQCNVRPGEYVGVPPGQALIVIGDIETLHIRVDIDENDLPRFKPGLRGRAMPRGGPNIDIPIRFVRLEPLVIPKKSLTGAGTERVDTRVLQVIYAVEAGTSRLYVGQQVDVFLEITD